MVLPVYSIDARRKRSSCTGVLVLAWLALLPAASAAAAEPGRGVLIDAIHANDFSTAGLRPGDYRYHEIYGYRHGFEYLKSRRVPIEYAREGRLDAARLARGRLLFINLASAERPPFLVSEIAAIRAFVEGGGSLFVVTDHTNVYYHAFRLQPLFEELGIATFTDAACDEAPFVLGGGNGWIAVRRFTRHPVTAGLECIAFQTGGCVDPRFAVAWTSERSWADAWSIKPFGEESVPGFYGNFTRDPGERPGPLGVILAKELGKGRIVVVGDQNFLGDPFLNYADNYRLWLNAMAWLLRDDRLADPRPYREWKSPRVVLYEQYDQSAWGGTDGCGCHHAAVLVSRYHWTFANDRLDEACDLIVFADNDRQLSEPALAAVAAHLKRGKNLLVLNVFGELLDDETGVVGRVLRALGTPLPSAGMKGPQQVIQVPSGGRIYLLGSQSAIDNTTIADPTRAPKPAEAQRGELLLDAVRGALGTATR